EAGPRQHLPARRLDLRRCQRLDGRSATNGRAAVALMPGSRCSWVCMVDATLAWLRCSLTTLAGTPSMICSGAWVWGRSWNQILVRSGRRTMENFDPTADHRPEDRRRRDLPLGRHGGT